MSFNKKLFLNHIRNLAESYYMQHQGRLAPFLSKFKNQPRKFDNVCSQYAQQLISIVKSADISRVEELRIQTIAAHIDKQDLIMANELIKNTKPNLRSLIPDNIQKFVERYS